MAFTGNPVFPLANSVFHAHPPGFGPEQTEQWNAGHEAPSSEQRWRRFPTAFQRIVGDPNQRFGPIILILAILGFVGGRASRENRILIVVFIVQLMVWLFATHLFARFATPMLIPLCLLSAGSVVRMDVGRWRNPIIAATLVCGAAYSFYFVERLYDRERAGFDVVPASIFYDGQVPGFEYLRYINHELPTNAHLLMVGDSKAFYIQRRVDYSVVFNESPLARLMRDRNSPADIIQWLVNSGYTHVMVNWSEITRLRATYGFPSELDEALFDRLQESGLRLLSSFPNPTTGRRYVDLYEVPSMK